MKINLKEELEKQLDCEISNDDLIRKFYSVDASFYKIKPQIVIFPKSEKDIIKIIKIAKKYNASVTARGAGTGLVGSALGKHIVLDFKKMNKIKIQKNTVRIEPGVIKGILDERLAKQRKFFAPNPSVGKYCSIGGMIGTNASGSHALKYGSVIDNILEVTVIDGNGKKITLPKNKKTGKQILSIAKKVDQEKFVKISKNSCGYRLNSIKNMQDSHKIIAGSEGTLGIVTSAKFKIRDIPKRKALVIISYKKVHDIHCDVNKITKLNPAAVEYLDSHTIKNIEHNFPKQTIASLFVEFDERLSNNIKKITNMAKGKIEFITYKSNEIQKWWNYRNSALAYSLRTISKKNLTPHIIEDAALPIENLENIFEIIKSINKKYKTKTIVYGHAGNGNLHVRLVMKKHSKTVLKNTAKLFFKEIFNYGGTITAEHGDGIARSEFVKIQYGRKNYQLFKELKKTFDPQNILNPGKIIAQGSKMVQNLEY